MPPIAKVLIVEDEFSIALDIQLGLEQLGYTVVEIAHSYQQAIQYTKKLNPELILMDIHLSDTKTGIDAARDIYQDYDIPIVFLTAYGDDRTFQEALQSQPFGYVLKPFKIQEVSFALQIALQKHQQQKTHLSDNLPVTDTLFIKDKSQLISVKLDQILWAEAMDNYTCIITPQRKIVVNMFLKDFHEKVPQNKFIRVHRSYIVALDKIEKIDDSHIFIQQRSIPVSKAYKQPLLEKLTIL